MYCTLPLISQPVCDDAVRLVLSRSCPVSSYPSHHHLTRKCYHYQPTRVADTHTYILVNSLDICDKKLWICLICLFVDVQQFDHDGIRSVSRIVQLKVGFVHLYKSAQTKTRRHSDIALQSKGTRWAGHRNCNQVWYNVMYCCADVQVRCPVWCLHCCDFRWPNIFPERCNIFTDVKCDNTTFMLQSWCWLEALQAACWRVRPRLSSVLRIWSIYFFLKLNIFFKLPSLIVTYCRWLPANWTTRSSCSSRSTASWARTRCVKSLIQS